MSYDIAEYQELDSIINTAIQDNLQSGTMFMIIYYNMLSYWIIYFWIKLDSSILYYIRIFFQKN